MSWTKQSCSDILFRVESCDFFSQPLQQLQHWRGICAHIWKNKQCVPGARRCNVFSCCYLISTITFAIKTRNLSVIVPIFTCSSCSWHQLKTISWGAPWLYWSVTDIGFFYWYEKVSLQPNFLFFLCPHSEKIPKPFQSKQSLSVEINSKCQIHIRINCGCFLLFRSTIRRTSLLCTCLKLFQIINFTRPTYQHVCGGVSQWLVHFRNRSHQMIFHTPEQIHLFWIICTIIKTDSKL